MYKHELTDEYKAMLRGVIDGAIPMVQREGEPSGYTEAKYGECYLFGYTWRDAKGFAKKALVSDVDVLFMLDGDFTWFQARIAERPIESIHNYKGGEYTKPKHYKPRARVALESLRKRLDGGVL